MLGLDRIVGELAEQAASSPNASLLVEVLEKSLISPLAATPHLKSS